MTAQPPHGEPPMVPEAVPVCPRHPDRESYVRCQRCERPVCPQCQRPAPVGVQCVDCVREAARTTRTARTVFGGEVTQGRPVVTLTVIGMCVAAYLLQWVVPGFTERFMYVPVLSDVQPWRFLTAAFLHSPSFLLHIAFNMYALWLFGPYLEQLLGRARFAALYLLSALGGSVGVLLLADPMGTSWLRPVVGASGAVFGLWGALMVINKRLGRDNSGLIVLLIINAAIGFFPGFNIAWQGHLGGFVTGLLAAAVIAYVPASVRRLGHPLGLAAVGVLLVALTLAKLGTVPAELMG